MHSYNICGSMMNIEITSPDTTADSENESLIVNFSNGDVHVDDLLSETECEEIDVEIETTYHALKPQFLNNPSDDPVFLELNDEAETTRAKTRLLSRSHSANDLTSQPDTLSVSSLTSEPPRRNSSGEYPTFDIQETPNNKVLGNAHLQDIGASNKQLKNLQQRNSLTPTSGAQPSPISMPYTPQRWKNTQDSNQDKEDEFSVLLQVTAERVLNRLKSRQQDLDSNVAMGQKYQRRPSHGLQPPVPRKLQPILRDGSKTPRSESDMRSIHGDSDLGPLSAA